MAVVVGAVGVGTGVGVGLVVVVVGAEAGFGAVAVAPIVIVLVAGAEVGEITGGAFGPGIDLLTSAIFSIINSRLAFTISSLSLSSKASSSSKFFIFISNFIICFSIT